MSWLHKEPGLLTELNGDNLVPTHKGLTAFVKPYLKFYCMKELCWSAKMNHFQDLQHIFFLNSHSVFYLLSLMHHFVLLDDKLVAWTPIPCILSNTRWYNVYLSILSSLFLTDITVISDMDLWLVVHEGTTQSQANLLANLHTVLSHLGFN